MPSPRMCTLRASALKVYRQLLQHKMVQEYIERKKESPERYCGGGQGEFLSCDHLKESTSSRFESQHLDGKKTKSSAQEASKESKHSLSPWNQT